jgi:hypothetical protein
MLSAYSSNFSYELSDHKQVEHLKVLESNTPVTLTLIHLNPPLDDESALDVLITCTGEDGQGPEDSSGSIESSIKSLSSASAQLSFLITKTGSYYVTLVRESTTKRLDAAPIRVNVVPGNASVNTSVLTGLRSTVPPHSHAHIHLVAYDSASNRVTTGGDKVTLEVDGMGESEGVADNGDGTYTLSFLTHAPEDTAEPLVVPQNNSPTNLKSHSGFIDCATSDTDDEFVKTWFELRGSLLISYGAAGVGGINSETGKRAKPLYTLNLAECAVSSHVSFPESPHPAENHFQVVSADVTLCLACEADKSCGEWLTSLKAGARAGVASPKARSPARATRPSSNSIGSDTAVIKVCINGTILTQCPFTVRVSAKESLEEKIRRRSSASEVS